MLATQKKVENVGMSNPTSDPKMSKQELVSAVAKAAGQTEATVRAVLDTTTEIMTNTLAAGGQPYGLGLGRFSTTRRPAKKARDIRRRIEVTVPERVAVVFRPSKPLTEIVNGSRS